MQSTTILHSCLVFLKLKVLTASAKSSLYSLEACSILVQKVALTVLFPLNTALL